MPPKGPRFAQIFFLPFKAKNTPPPPPLSPTLLEAQNKFYRFKFVYSVNFLDWCSQFISPTKCTIFVGCCVLFFVYVGVN